ncbi:hypothetical protein TRIP_B250228 [uncultured Desulfatiglans sp.]|nr:hypothetical protein TRIP_B250228 [uncultured Desulfatiglans sp.]
MKRCYGGSVKYRSVRPCSGKIIQRLLKRNKVQVTPIDFSVNSIFEPE